MLWTSGIRAYCSMNSSLSMLASRKVKTLVSVHPTPGKSMMGPYSLRHSVRVSVSTLPSARRTSIVVGTAVIGTGTPSTR